MGGYNSGRRGWRGVIECQQRLDIRMFVRRGWLHRSSGSYQWSSDGEPAGSVSYTVSADALDLRYTVPDEVEDIPVHISIPIRRTPCRYGGERHYWGCPNCGRWCEVVVMASHGRYWGCRRCLRLRYISQGLAPADRAQRRADQLYARAGAEDDDGLVHKHKWMRWRTFNRLMDRADNLSAVANDAFVYRALRLLART